jgi:hypothetical protein
VFSWFVAPEFVEALLHGFNACQAKAGDGFMIGCGIFQKRKQLLT